MTKTEIAQQYALENGYEVVDMPLVTNYSHRTVYAVFERIAGHSTETLSKLFTNEDAAWRWAAIKEDEAVSLHMAGKEPVLYSYVVVPWELHEQ